MSTEKELDERTMREGKKYDTKIELTVTTTGDDYAIGAIMATRDGHELEDGYLWGSDSGDLWIAAAKLRGCSINVEYLNSTYILDENVITAITEVDIKEIGNE